MQIPNGCGSFLGLMQLILYAIYRNNKGTGAGAGKAVDEVEDAKKATVAMEMAETKVAVDEPAAVDKVAAQV